MWYLDELNIVGVHYSDAARWMEANLLLDGEPFRLLPWQREMIAAPVERKIVASGRRAGATVAMVANALYLAHVEGQSVVIATHNDAAVLTIWRYIENMCPSLTPTSPVVPDRWRIGPGEIVVMAANDRICGMSPDYLCIDNASFISDDVMDALLRSGIRSGTLINTTIPTSEYIRRLHAACSQMDSYRIFLTPTMHRVDLGSLREAYAEEIQRIEEWEIIPTGDAYVITTNTTDGEYAPTVGTPDQIGDWVAGRFTSEGLAVDTPTQGEYSITGEVRRP